jgi:uncharacterized Zn-binding protein involved in type VI secretion
MYAGENMNRPWIVVGDKTSKGGIVFTGSPEFTVDGKGMSCIGDRATCRCDHCISRGYTVIVTGSPSFTVHDVPVARHGDVTDCGALLISTEGASFSQAQRIASGSTDPSSHSFDQGFLIHDEATGQPARGRRYRMTYCEGVLEGRTDENGFTDRPSAAEAESIQIEIFPEGI